MTSPHLPKRENPVLTWLLIQVPRANNPMHANTKEGQAKAEKRLAEEYPEAAARKKSRQFQGAPTAQDASGRPESQAPKEEDEEAGAPMGVDAEVIRVNRMDDELEESDGKHQKTSGASRPLPAAGNKSGTAPKRASGKSSQSSKRSKTSKSVTTSKAPKTSTKPKTSKAPK
ncbi:uncharacterized protein LOC62_02G002264 [Vanrija pseudolonga]|uniref:Uncharacterized protein n=1 Tax=Vanrija pseudolonga TaxID=143232 RepID=A0AAF0Y235_9TREE|nr:hypothetical protein LOC62_02G002264 [Vanrija pseudolonga]